MKNLMTMAPVMPLSEPQSNSPAWVARLKLDQSPWGKLSRHVFWDRSVSLEDWRQGIKEAHPSYLPQSIMRMNPKQLIRYYGKEDFIRDWPEIVCKVSDRQTRFRALWMDLNWSLLVAGNYDLVPVAQFWKIEPRCREFLICLSANPGINAHQAAEMLNMHCRRARYYVQIAVSTGMFFTSDEPQLDKGERGLWPAPRWPVSQV